MIFRRIAIHTPKGQKLSQLVTAKCHSPNGAEKASEFSRLWPCGGVVTQRIANPFIHSVFKRFFLSQTAEPKRNTRPFCHKLSTAEGF